MRAEPEEPSICVLANCKRPVDYRVDSATGICQLHAGLIWSRVEWRDANNSDVEIVGREWRDYERVEARAKRTAGRRKPTAAGEIYFVKVDELIKVGWTTKLHDRVRAYGPKAELLVNYPGTRADEAALHRQLTPARYRGREWYSDGQIIRAFVAEALEKYGRPRFERVDWTEPKRIVAGKRFNRAA